MKIYTVIEKDDDVNVYHYVTKGEAIKQRNTLELQGKHVLGVLEGEIRVFSDKPKGTLNILGSYSPGINSFHIETMSITNDIPLGIQVSSDVNITIPRHFMVKISIPIDKHTTKIDISNKCQQLCNDFFLRNKQLLEDNK